MRIILKFRIRNIISCINVRGVITNKIAPLLHKRQEKQDMCAEGVKFYCPSSTYPAIVLIVLYFIDYL